MIVNLLNKLIQVSEGGTGANNAADALANLGGVEIVDAQSAEYDMDAILKSGAHFKIYKTNNKTLGTPYNKGDSTLFGALIISYATTNFYGKQLALTSGGKVMYERNLSAGNISEWTKIVNYRDRWEELSLSDIGVKQRSYSLKYYPYLDMCHFSIEFDVPSALDTGLTSVIGTVPSEYAPTIRQALSVDGLERATAYVNNDGEIVYRAGDDIPKGRLYAVSGWWKVN